MTAWLPVLIPGALPLAAFLAAPVWYSLGGRRAARRLWNRHLKRRDARDFDRRFGRSQSSASRDTEPMDVACADEVAVLIALAEQQQAVPDDTVPMPALHPVDPYRPQERRLAC